MLHNLINSSILNRSAELRFENCRKSKTRSPGSINLYLRNLPTHTVNNLQQKLNYVKLIKISVIKQNFNIIHIMCENFRTISLVLCNIQPFQYKRVKPKSHKNWNLGL